MGVLLDDAQRWIQQHSKIGAVIRPHCLNVSDSDKLLIIQVGVDPDSSTFAQGEQIVATSQRGRISLVCGRNVLHHDGCEIMCLSGDLFEDTISYPTAIEGAKAVVDYLEPEHAGTHPPSL